MANGKCPETIKALGHEYRLTIETRNGETYPLYIRQETDAQGKLHTYALEIRIRKLTPRECFRLMDVPDSRIDQLMQTHTVRKKRDGKEVEVKEQIVSNSQLYKQAGNSIVVSCLKHIFDNIFYPKPLERASIKAFTQLELF